MARLRILRVGATTAFAASGAISQELSPIPFTMTGLLVVVHADVTTTSTPAGFEDGWDRHLTRLSLTGMVNNQQKTLFDFSNMRIAYHDQRFSLGAVAPIRPAPIAISQTNALQQFCYYFHFGVQPFLPDGSYNPMDVSAGIPPVEKGQMTIGGTFGTATAMGTAVTANVTASNYLEYYVVGVQAEPGDDPVLTMPRAFPVWSMNSPTLAATSTTFGTSFNVPAGAFLRAITLMTTKGTGTPRSDIVLNSIRLYDQYGNREIISYGGKSGTSDASGGDYKVAELLSQMMAKLSDAPRSDDINAALAAGGTALAEGRLGIGVPSLAQVSEGGLVHWPLSKYTTRVHPLYGADLRKLATGDIRFDYGIASATATTLDILFKRYELNPNHPANAGLV